MTEEVLVSQEGSVLIVTINRPEAKNAMNAATAHGISAAMDELDNNDELTVGIITGADNTFCAGMDLKAFLKGETPQVEGKGFGGITQSPPRKPLIAAVEGYALAGGFELLLACDLIVAAESAKFGISEVKRGLVAGAGGLIRLPRQVPYRLAMELALLGDFVDAATAKDMGMINRIVPTGGALEAAKEMAAKIAENGPLAVAVSKQIVRESGDWSDEEMWEKQSKIMMPVFNSADAQEGPTAFAEKRKPVWTGK